MRIAHILIFGFVQGVGYRKFVRQQAQKLGLVGWVRNLPEGTVEAEVAGDKEIIEELITFCRKGPFLAQVKHVEVEWEEKEFEYQEFVMRHDTD